MKKTTLLLGALLIGSVTSTYALDDVVIPFAPSVSTVTEMSERHESMKLDTLSRIKIRGTQVINERISSLQANAETITKSSLTDTQKKALTTIINSNITGLSTLRASIAAGTDATSTRALVESVYTNFRIYGIVIPQIRLQKRIYDLENHITKLNMAFTKVQTKINETKAQGKDVTIWQKSLDDAKLRVATDTVTLSRLMVEVSALKPSDYGTTSKTTIKNVNDGLKDIVKDFRNLEKSVKRALKLPNLTATSTSATSSTSIR